MNHHDPKGSGFLDNPFIKGELMDFPISTREYPTIIYKPRNKLLNRNLIKDDPFKERCFICLI